MQFLNKFYRNINCNSRTTVVSAVRYISKLIGVIVLAGQTSEVESLFVYDTGSSHASFVKPSFRPLFEPPTIDDATRENVTRMCYGKQQCVFDYFTTGEMTLALASAKAVLDHEDVVEASQKGKRKSFTI